MRTQPPCEPAVFRRKPGLGCFTSRCLRGGNLKCATRRAGQGGRGGERRCDGGGEGREGEKKLNQTECKGCACAKVKSRIWITIPKSVYSWGMLGGGFEAPCGGRCKNLPLLQTPKESKTVNSLQQSFKFMQRVFFVVLSLNLNGCRFKTYWMDKTVQR